jgi:hypothetical protein
MAEGQPTGRPNYCSSFTNSFQLTEDLDLHGKVKEILKFLTFQTQNGVKVTLYYLNDFKAGRATWKKIPFHQLQPKMLQPTKTEIQ